MSSGRVKAWSWRIWRSPLAVCLNSGDRLAEDERVDLARPLVGQHRLEVVDVADDRVFEGDPVGAQDGPCRAANLERLADVVQLPEGDVLRGDPALVLHPAEMIGNQGRLVELEQHVDQLLLGQLEGGDRLAELLSRLRVVER